MNSAIAGYRGYIGTRPIFGQSTPQHVQNLVVRDYAQKHDLRLELSATEYVMPGCYMILRQILDELPACGGIIAFSMFMLPPPPRRRRAIYETILAQHKTLHFALETLPLATPDDVERIEDIWLLQKASRQTPDAGQIAQLRAYAARTD